MSITFSYARHDPKTQAASSLLREIVACWRSLMRDLFDTPAPSVLLMPARANRPYRPERHYMRGPGPKWRAKYGSPE
jgi:hypothetical protein